VNQEIRYQTTTYLLGLFLTFGTIIEISDKSDFLDFIYDFATLSVMVTCFLWLRKTVVFVGLLFFLIGFNIDLLTHPLFHEESHQQLSVASTILILDVIGTILVLAGLIDSYFDDKYIKHRINLSLEVLLALVLGVTFVFQFVAHSVY
jgi:uncharacterized membrane protein